MTADCFELFGLPQRQAIDTDDLAKRHQDLLVKLHPDRHVNSSPSERRLAEQYAADVNEACRVLTDPLSRAGHLLALRGSDPFTEQSASGRLPPDFLARQLELHESFDEIEASGDRAKAAKFADELAAEVAEGMRALTALLDDEPQQVDDAVAAVLRLRYLRNSEAKATALAGKK